MTWARWFGGILAACAVLVLPGCVSTTQEFGAGPADDPSDLTVCSDVPFKPFEMRVGGRTTGFDIDLMHKIAKGMGLTMSLRDVDFDALQSGKALDAGRCDVVASAMTITADRETHLDFSEPYYDSQQSLLVPKGSDVTSIDDLASRRVAVQQGTTGQTYTEANVPKGAKVVSFVSDGAMYRAIKTGDVDALLQDLPVNLAHEENGDFTIVQRYSTGEQYGFAVAQGDARLLAAVNRELEKLRGNGTYDRLYGSYFSSD